MRPLHFLNRCYSITLPDTVKVSGRVAWAFDYCKLNKAEKDFPWIPREYLLQEWFDLERRGGQS